MQRQNDNRSEPQVSPLRNADIQVVTKTDELENIASNNFKRVSPKNSTKKNIIAPCFCGTCSILNEEQILSIYKNGHMIEDNSRLIFNVFTEKVTMNQ